MLLVVDGAALFGRFVHLGQRQPALERQQQQPGHGKAGDGRGHQRHADVDGLAPVHPFAQRQVGDERIGQAHAQDRADQRVRTGGGNAEVPGAQVPGDGRRQHGEHHRKPAAGIDIDQQFDGQQMDDGVGDAHAAQQHAQKIEDAGQDHREVGRHGLGVDDGCHGVRRVMKTVDEFEGQDECQGQHKTEANPKV